MSDAFWKNFWTMSDDQLRSWASERMSRATPTDIMSSNAAFTELSLRSEAATRRSVDQLVSTIREFRQSSDTYSRRILRLTWALVFLTIVLVLPVAEEIPRLMRHSQTKVPQNGITSPSDPLGPYAPYGDAQASCLKQVSPTDPLGLFAEDAAQEKLRKECLNRIGTGKRETPQSAR